MNETTARRWMKIATVGAAAYGLGLGISAVVPGALAPLQAMMGITFLGDPGVYSPVALLFINVTGSIIFGWVIMFHLLARIDDVPPAVWRTAVWGLVAWFLFDCAGSILTGAAHNVFANLGFYVGLLPPAVALSRPRRPVAVSDTSDTSELLERAA